MSRTWGLLILGLVCIFSADGRDTVEAVKHYVNGKKGVEVSSDGKVDVSETSASVINGDFTTMIAAILDGKESKVFMSLGDDPGLALAVVRSASCMGVAAFTGNVALVEACDPRTVFASDGDESVERAKQFQRILDSALVLAVRGYAHGALPLDAVMDQPLATPAEALLDIDDKRLEKLQRQKRNGTISGFDKRLLRIALKANKFGRQAASEALKSGKYTGIVEYLREGGALSSPSLLTYTAGLLWSDGINYLLSPQSSSELPRLETLQLTSASPSELTWSGPEEPVLDRVGPFLAATVGAAPVIMKTSSLCVSGAFTDKPDDLQFLYDVIGATGLDANEFLPSMQCSVAKIRRAVDKWMTSTLQALIVGGQDPMDQPENAPSPLQVVADSGLTEAFHTLLPEFPKEAIDHHFDHSNRSALHFAAMRCNADIYDALVSAGANPDLPSSYGITPRELLEYCDFSKQGTGEVPITVEQGYLHDHMSAQAIQQARDHGWWPGILSADAAARILQGESLKTDVCSPTASAGTVDASCTDGYRLPHIPPHLADSHAHFQKWKDAFGGAVVNTNRAANLNKKDHVEMEARLGRCDVTSMDRSRLSDDINTIGLYESVRVPVIVRADPRPEFQDDKISRRELAELVRREVTESSPVPFGSMLGYGPFSDRTGIGRFLKRHTGAPMPKTMDGRFEPSLAVEELSRCEELQELLVVSSSVERAEEKNVAQCDVLCNMWGEAMRACADERDVSAAAAEKFGDAARIFLSGACRGVSCAMVHKSDWKSDLQDSDEVSVVPHEGYNISLSLPFTVFHPLEDGTPPYKKLHQRANTNANIPGRTSRRYTPVRTILGVLPPGGGMGWHLSQNAWIHSSAGTVLHALLPPKDAVVSSRHPLHNIMRAANATHTPLICVQYPGDTLYLPEGWSHSEISLQDSVVIYEQFFYEHAQRENDGGDENEYEEISS